MIKYFGVFGSSIHEPVPPDANEILKRVWSNLLVSKIPISLKDAKARGYTPCSRCNPPK